MSYNLHYCQIDLAAFITIIAMNFHLLHLAIPINVITTLAIVKCYHHILICMYHGLTHKDPVILVGYQYCISFHRRCLYLSAWDWMSWLYTLLEIKEPTAFCMCQLYNLSYVKSRTTYPYVVNSWYCINGGHWRGQNNHWCCNNPMSYDRLVMEFYILTI